MSMSGLFTAASGLKTSQTGLSVTSHNLANVNTVGYTRQQLLQHDTAYLNVGTSNGGSFMQKGIGVSNTEIRQIRDEFADARYRTENSVLAFYQVQSSTSLEIEAILDEPYGEALSQVFESFWSQAQKLSTNPSGVEERMAFIQSASVMVQRINHIQDSLKSYQDNLNSQIINSVNRINEITADIDNLNTLISLSEIGGDNANDYRDARNVLLDELSGYMDIDYYELADNTVVIKSNNRILVKQGFVTEIGLAQTEPMSPYVKPVWADTQADVFNFTDPDSASSQVVNSEMGNDQGSLKALLLSRGPSAADEETTWADVTIDDRYSVDVSGNSYIIPEMQMKLNVLLTEIVSSINDTLNGEGIGVHEGLVGEPMFVPINSGTVTAPVLPDNPTAADIAAYNEAMLEYHENIKEYLTIDNIQVNPALLAEGGYNKLGTVTETGNNGDNSKVQDMLESWSSKRMWYAEYDDDGNIVEDPNAPYAKLVNFQDFYAEFVTELGQDGYEYASRSQEKYDVVNSLANERWARSNVSQDEELSTMMKYQYAYNAASRVMTIMDGMLDKVINQM